MAPETRTRNINAECLHLVQEIESNIQTSVSKISDRSNPQHNLVWQKWRRYIDKWTSRTSKCSVFSLAHNHMHSTTDSTKKTTVTHRCRVC